MRTVYVSIGNSDDKLTQRDWVAYTLQADLTLRGLFLDLPPEEIDRHGDWRSLPDAVWQNVCWCIEIPDELVEPVQRQLRELAQRFGQESIAWAEVSSTEFLMAAIEP